MGIKIILEDKLGRHPQVHRTLAMSLRFHCQLRLSVQRCFPGSVTPSFILSPILSLPAGSSPHATPVIFLFDCGSQSLLLYPPQLFISSHCSVSAVTWRSNFRVILSTQESHRLSPLCPPSPSASQTSV